MDSELNNISEEIFEAVKMEIKPSCLYLVAVPIGNLHDFTPRALYVLKKADYIACEEVQSARKLLKSQNIEGRLISYRESGREVSGEKIVELLAQGKVVAVISGAGTPAVSDPGRDLVLKCHEAGFKVSPVPGASALTAAVSAAGLPSRRFAFEGFLPRQDGERREFLESLALEERTMIFFEAPHRILSSLRALKQAFGNRRAFIGRELTKFFEECTLSSLDELCRRYEEKEPKGEFAVVVEGFREDESAKALREREAARADCEFLKGLDLSKRDMAAILTHFRNMPKNKAKQLVMDEN